MPTHYLPLASLFLLAFSCLAFAIPASSIGTGSSAVSLAYDIALPPKAHDATLDIYIFPNTTAQLATFFASLPFTSTTDEFGNPMLTFDVSAAASKEVRISVDSEVKVSYDPAKALFEPVSSAGPDYLSPSSLANSDEAITTLAQSVAGGYSDPMQKAAALSEWVYNNIKYDLNYKELATNSSMVLLYRRGTCDEKSHLLISMLRSQGIPARHVVGFAYSGETWESHAWVEAAIGGEWVPIDPTFNEFMFIDGGHIKLAVGRDKDDTHYKLSAKGVSDLSGAKLVFSKDVSLGDVSAYSRFYSLLAGFPSGEFSAGSFTSINATATNRYRKRIAVAVNLKLPDEFPLYDSPGKVLIIQPGQSATAVWNLTFPLVLKDGFFYNYSAFVIGYQDIDEGYLFARQAPVPQSVAALSLDDLFARKLEDGVDINCRIKNRGNTAIAGATATLGSGNFSLFISLPEIGVGETILADYLVPYWQIRDAKEVRGNITLKYDGKTTISQFNVDLSEPSPAPKDPNTIELTPQFLTSPQFLLFAAFAVVAVILLTVFLRKSALG